MLDSPTNQDICRKLVQREVGHCVSSLVHHFATNPEAAGEYYDDVLDLCSQPDWENAVRDHDLFVREEDGAVVTLDHTEGEESYHSSWVDAGLYLDIDPYESEAFEHWIVSEFLAEKLREKGELVGELFGLTIWGRCTTGQSIYIDRVIGETAHDMEILEGQRYSWEGK